MKVVYDPRHEGHAPRTFLVRGRLVASPEGPARAEALLARARADGHPIVAPRAFAPALRAAVHGPDYLRFLETAHDRWQALAGADDEVLPNVHPNRHAAAYPQGIVGQAGHHMVDTACPIGAATWEAACAAAEVAATAAALVREGAPAAYALCRPPGHHAYPDVAGGFCYLNNVAIAAAEMRAQHDRVAILDIDVHHGNGTQAIFYDRADVLFASVHADPADFYPFFAGYAHERGAGPGLGYSRNLPLAPGADDRAWLTAVESALSLVRAFAPGALLVSLGFDAFAGDPLSPLAVTTEGFAAAARAIAGLALPTVLVQEGGYDCASLGDNLGAFLAAFEGGAG